jgi:methionyl-tRNA synthetase
LRWLAALLYPVMPTTANEIYQQLGLGHEVGKTNPRELRWGTLKPVTQIQEVRPLFPRIDKKKTMEEIKEQESGAGRQEPGSETRPSSPTGGEGAVERTPAGSGQHATEADAVPGVASYIEITDFTKIELRVGEVKTAERIPKADKLLLLSVDVGEEKPRTILAGIAQYYEPESLVGRKIVVVANLKPRKLRGYESQGMLLAASIGEEGKPVIATFAEDVPNGARLK